jgi:hypothetical protein
LLNNVKQAYDDGNNNWHDDYPYGGNSWSNYWGMDLFSATDQNLQAADSIGDTPVEIEGGDNLDRYTLMVNLGLNPS